MIRGPGLIPAPADRVSHPPGQPRATRRTTPARLGSGRGWAAHRRLLAAEPPGRRAGDRPTSLRGRPYRSRLPGDVLAPPIDALADAQRGTRLGVGGRDSLPLLVGDLSAGAGRDLVDPVEDLVHMLVEAFLSLRLPFLIRGNQACGSCSPPGDNGCVCSRSSRLSISAPSRAAAAAFSFARAFVRSAVRSGIADQKVDPGGTLQRRPHHPALTPWGRPWPGQPFAAQAPSMASQPPSRRSWRRDMHT
jgi:hypothetical protein